MKIVFYSYLLKCEMDRDWPIWGLEKWRGGEKKGWGVVEEIKLVTDHSTARERGDNLECFQEVLTMFGVIAPEYHGCMCILQKQFICPHTNALRASMGYCGANQPSLSVNPLNLSLASSIL